MTIQQSQARSQTERKVALITREILAVYDDARKAINADLAKLYQNYLSGIAPEDYYNTVIKFDRLTKMLAEIDKQYIAASVKAGRMTVRASRTAMTDAYFKNQYVLDWFTPNAGIDLDFTMIPPQLVDLSVTGNLASWEALSKSTRDRIESTFGSVTAYIPKAGTLSSILVNNRRDEVLKINRAITSGLLQGKGYRETAKDVSKVIGSVSKTKSSGAMASAIRIVRTESNRTYNAGAYANSQAVSDQGVEIKRVWVATLDLKTRGKHQSLDGQSVGVDERFSSGGAETLYPGGFGIASQDIECRCTTIDAVDGIPPSARSGVDIAATTEAQAQAKANGATKKQIDKIKVTKIFDWQSYPEWLKDNTL